MKIQWLVLSILIILSLLYSASAQNTSTKLDTAPRLSTGTPGSEYYGLPYKVSFNAYDDIGLVSVFWSSSDTAPSGGTFQCSGTSCTNIVEMVSNSIGQTTITFTATDTNSNTTTMTSLMSIVACSTDYDCGSGRGTGKICSSGKCVSATATPSSTPTSIGSCTDSDGGTNYNTKGMVYYTEIGSSTPLEYSGRSPFTDSCISYPGSQPSRVIGDCAPGNGCSIMEGFCRLCPKTPRKVRSAR